MGRSAEEEFTEFLRASRSDLRRTAYLLCGSWDDAEDAVQTALYKVYLNWWRLSGSDRPWSYARRAVVNATINISRRASSREVPTLHMPDVASAESSGTVDDRMLLRLALASLPARQRAVVVLRYVEQLDVAETAVVLRCAQGTVKSATARALENLRAFLTSHGLVRGSQQKDAS